MKTYDYKDEQKDVKGKVRNNSFSKSANALGQLPNWLFNQITKHTHLFWFFYLLDWALKRYHWALADAPRLEKCSECDHPQLGRGDADDREKHFQTATER